MKRQNIRTLARRCMKHAWRDQTDDRSRRLLEQSARELTRLARRCLSLAHALELTEATHKRGAP